MDNTTAEQAAENAKGLTFETVWAAFMKTDERIKEMAKKATESQQKTEKLVADLSKNIGGRGNSFGRLIETMLSTDLLEKFNELGYSFTRQTSNSKYIENKTVIAEVEVILENGEYAMLVEIKTELTATNVDDHLKRIERVRQYMDGHNDGRKLVGAVAGGIVPDNVMNYAHKKGLFVLLLTGDSLSIAKTPDNFKIRSW